MEVTHDWPKDPAEHKWGRWVLRTGLPKATEWRGCVDPDCKAFEVRDVPKRLGAEGASVG